MLYSSAKYLKNAAFKFMRESTARRSEILRRPAVDVKNIAANERRTVGEVLVNLDTRKYNIVHVVDDHLNVLRSLDEADIFDGILEHGAGEQIRSIIKNDRK